MLKDFLLTSTIEESYLKKNYMSLTPEVDARKNGHIETDNYFLSLGIMPRTNTLKKIMLDKKRNGNDYRYLNGKEYTVDTLFDEKILQIIDVLKNEYKVKDTLDNLRRLQRDNDDNLNRVSFIKKLVFK